MGSLKTGKGSLKTAKMGGPRLSLEAEKGGLGCSF